MGMLELGLLVWGGAPWPFPLVLLLSSRSSLSWGRVLSTTLPTGRGGVVHLFVVYGYQGAEEDAEKLRLTDRLLQAVLVEAQMVCIGQPHAYCGRLEC